MGAFLSLIFSLILFVGWIMVTVKGFKQSTSWGLISLLVPLGAFFFMAKFWEDAKGPGKILLIGFIGYIVSSFVFPSDPFAGMDPELLEGLEGLE